MQVSTVMTVTRGCFLVILYTETNIIYFLLLQVNVKVSSVTLVEIQITNSPDHLYLHWGGTRNKKEQVIMRECCSRYYSINESSMPCPKYSFILVFF